MHRIDTPTADPDANGVGKAGFRAGAPPGVASTRLDEAWFNAVQEEIANAIELSGLTLEKTNTAQLAAVLASLQAGAPAMAALANISLVDDTAGQEYLAIGEESGGNLLGVGKSGLIALSTDRGETWTEQSPAGAFAGDFHAVLYIGVWIIAGTSGEIQTSPDGVTWTHRSAGSSYTGTFKAGAKGPSSNAALVGTGGEIQTSADGVTWTRRQTGGADFTWVAGHTSPAWWLAVRGDGNIYRSTTAATWTLVQATGGAGGYLDHSALDTTYLVYQGSTAANFWVSRDSGATWTQYPSASVDGGARILGMPDGSWLLLTSSRLKFSPPDVTAGLWRTVLAPQARMNAANAPTVGFVTRFSGLGQWGRLFLAEPGGDQLWASLYAPG